jgi:phage-related protein
MDRWIIEFFEDTEGNRPVRVWLDGLPEEVRGKVLPRSELLAEHGPSLDYPYTSQIKDKLREIRLRFGKVRYRVLYFFDETRTGSPLHSFTKNTETVEEADQRVAQLRMDAHTSRKKKPATREGRK